MTKKIMLKKVIATIVGMSVAASMLVMPVWAESENLYANGDMELGTSDWVIGNYYKTHKDSFPKDTLTTITGKDAYDGTSIQYTPIAGNDYKTAVLYQTVSLKADTFYKMSAWVKADPKANIGTRTRSNTKTIKLYSLDLSACKENTSLEGKRGFGTAYDTTATGEWVYMSNIIYPTQDITTDIGIGLQQQDNYVSVNRICIDDMALCEVEPETRILIPDKTMIPKDGEADSEVEVEGKIIIDGMELKKDGDALTYMLADDYTGVTLVGNKLIVSDEAYESEVRVDVILNGESIGQGVTELEYPGEKIPEMRDFVLSGNVEQGETLSVSYKYYDPQNKGQKAASYTWYGKTDTSEYELIEDEEESSYVIPEDCEYTHIKVVANVTNEEDVSSNDFIAEAVKPTKPEAVNVSVSGYRYAGETLTGEYDFEDVNGDEEGNSIYQWYKLKTLDSEPEPIENETGIDYVVKSTDVGGFIQFSVIPQSEHEPNPGIEGIAYSEPVEIYSEPEANIGNLYKNGAVEVGTKNWEISSGTDGYVLGAVSDDEAYDGTSIKYIPGSSTNAMLGQNVSLEGGKFYEISAWVRSDKTYQTSFKAKNSNSDIRLYDQDYKTYISIPSPDKNANLTYNSIVSANWSQMKNVLYVSKDITTFIGVGLNVSAGGFGEMYLDNLKITEVTPEIVVDYPESIKIPKYNEEDSSNALTTSIKIKNRELTLGTDLKYELDGEYQGVYISGNSIVVEDSALNTVVYVNVLFNGAVISKVGIEVETESDKPEIRDFKILGGVAEGVTLKTEFDYYDPNESSQSEINYQWFGSKDGVDWTMFAEGSDSQYTIEPGFAYSYVKVSATVKNNNEILSDASVTNISSIPEEPTVKDLSLNGYRYAGETLTASYTFEDANEGDIETGRTYKWYVLNSADEKPVTPVEGANSDKFALDNTHVGKFIVFSVLPVSSNAPQMTEETYSEAYEVYPTPETDKNNLFKNGSMEFGTRDWSVKEYHETFTETIVDATGDNAYNGQTAIEYTPDGHKNAALFQTITLQGKKFYKMSAWVKAEPGASISTRRRNNGQEVRMYSTDLQDYKSNLEGKYDFGVKYDQDVTDEWTYISNILYPVKNVECEIGLGLHRSTLPEKIYIDDVVLCEITPETEVLIPETIEIPKTGEAASEVEVLGKIIIDGVELKAGEGELTYTLVRDYKGVKLNGNKIIVSDEAYEDEVRVDVEFNGVGIGQGITKLVYSGEKKPEIRDFVLSGDVVAGQELSVSYIYYDPQNKAEKSVSYEWFAKTAAGEWTSLGITANRYNIPDGFTYDLVKVVGTVKNVNDVSSNTFETNTAGVPTAPEARNVKIDGEHFVGKKINATYDFYDLNYADKDTGSVYKWYRLEKADELPNDTQTEENNVIPGATSKEYTLTEADANKFIVFSVIPKSNEYPSTGEIAYSNVFEGPVAPVVSNVRIFGTAKPGSVLTVQYDYFHKYGVIEGDSIVKWYDNGKLIEEGNSITVKSSMDNITVEVTAISKEMPYEGNTAKSNAVTVKSSSSSSGGGSGGGISSSFGSVKPSTPTVPTEPVTPDVTPDKKTVFTDTQNHWAKDIIAEMVEKGIVNGVNENEFEPDRPIKRAEFTALICRAFDIKDYDETPVFSDVQPGIWYFENVQAAAKVGIVNGDNGKFNPDAEIERQAAAKMIMAVYLLTNEMPELTTTDIKYADMDKVAEWAMQAVNTLSELGIINGSDGMFNPTKSLTRAEAVVILSRTMELMAK